MEVAIGCRRLFQERTKQTLQVFQRSSLTESATRFGAETCTVGTFDPPRLLVIA
jgi:hypothetical protein